MKAFQFNAPPKKRWFWIFFFFPNYSSGNHHSVAYECRRKFHTDAFLISYSCHTSVISRFEFEETIFQFRVVKCTNIGAVHQCGTRLRGDRRLQSVLQEQTTTKREKERKRERVRESQRERWRCLAGIVGRLGACLGTDRFLYANRQPVRYCWHQSTSGLVRTVLQPGNYSGEARSTLHLSRSARSEIEDIANTSLSSFKTNRLAHKQTKKKSNVKSWSESRY